MHFSRKMISPLFFILMDSFQTKSLCLKTFRTEFNTKKKEVKLVDANRNDRRRPRRTSTRIEEEREYSTFNLFSFSNHWVMMMYGRERQY